MISPRILYADDHADTRHLITIMLERSGYQVAAAENLSQALSLAKTGNFSLYLLDSTFAAGSGKELCEQIRQFDERTPIVFYSGYTYEQVMADSECDTQGFVMKPYLDELPKIIGQALNAA